ncbi:daptomycin-sensing surface protein LiaX [Latilactobacillus graminis]|nr:daptomycin-sensing surface protein LiaX [Latilactobacillus graminis]QFP79951.1 DUF4097 family beta strand repeat protein [Latilactobacillus graminis]
MNERQRILDLVNQGILTSEEALVLLENLAKDDQDVKPVATEATTDQTEQQTADKSAMEEKAHALTVNLSGVNRQLQTLKQQMRADQEQVTVLDTMEDLDSLTSEKATERQTLKASLLQKQATVDELENKRQTLTEALNQIEKERRQLTKNQWSEKLGLSDDWKENASETFDELSDKLGEASSHFSKFVKNTAKTVMDNVDWKEVNFKVPGLATEKFTHDFIYADVTPNMLNVKVANGSVHFQIWDQPDIKVAAQVKLYGKMTEETPLAAFEARSTIDVTAADLVFQVPNKRIQADLTFYLPANNYSQTNVKLLNGDVELEGFTGHDIYLKTTNGELTLRSTNATMVEAENVNGGITFDQGRYADLLATTVNGNLVIQAQALNSSVSTVNGDIKHTLMSTDLHHLKAKSVNGTIKAALAQDLAMTVDARTRFGMIKNRLADTQTIEQRQSTGNQMLQLSRNDNEQAARLTLSTTTGNILLKDNDN